jgi:hypothetical protein
MECSFMLPRSMCQVSCYSLTTGHRIFLSRIRKWRAVRALRSRSEIDAQLKSHLLFIRGFVERIVQGRHFRAYIVPAYRGTVVNRN